MMAATTFRVIMDAGEDGYCLVVMDAGVEQTSPYSPFRFSQNELFDKGRLVRFAHHELGEGIRYKMRETAETVYLFP